MNEPLTREERARIVEAIARQPQHEHILGTGVPGVKWEQLACALKDLEALEKDNAKLRAQLEAFKLERAVHTQESEHFRALNIQSGETVAALRARCEQLEEALRDVLKHGGSTDDEWLPIKYYRQAETALKPKNSTIASESAR